MSKIGEPTTGRVRRWVIAFFVLWALGTVAAVIANDQAGQNFPAIYLALVCGIGSFMLIVITATIYYDRVGGRPPPLVQFLELDGTSLKVIKPLPWGVDLAADSAFVVRIGGRPGYASLRFLRQEGDVTIFCRTPSEPAHVSTLGDVEPLPGRWLGLRIAQDAFGDAIFRVVREHQEKNRFWTAARRLATHETEMPDDDGVVTLGDDDDDDALTYRSSGRPGPSDPGFGAWLAQNGLRLAETIELSSAHLVASCADGVQRAFPIGYTQATRHTEGLTLCSQVGEPYLVSLEDVALAEALVHWCEVLRDRTLDQLAPGVSPPSPPMG